LYLKLHLAIAERISVMIAPPAGAGLSY